MKFAGSQEIPYSKEIDLLNGYKKLMNCLNENKQRLWALIGGKFLQEFVKNTTIIQKFP